MQRFLKGVYDFLLLLGCLMLIVYLPKELDHFFNIDVFSKYPVLSAIIIIVILFLGYEAKESIKDDEISNKTMQTIKDFSSTINLVNYLNNYNYKDLKVIQYAYYKKINDFHIYIENTDIKINDVFVKNDILYNLDLKQLDKCLQNYTDELDSTKISIYIQNNYNKEINNGN